MIHVLNPYKLSISMFRMAIYTWETQMNALKLFTHVAAKANPVALTHDAAQNVDTAQGTPKPAAKPRVKATVAKAAVAVAEDSSSDAEPKRYRKPATPPTMPGGKTVQ